MPSAAAGVKIPATMHGVFDPDACEVYGILYAPSTGFNVAFTYEVDGEYITGLDISRISRLRPSLGRGMHEFTYYGQTDVPPIP